MTHGNLYDYRVVQTSVTRKDQLIGQGSPVPVTDDTDIGGDAYPTTAEILVNDRYDVTLTKNGNGFHFHYLIKGDTIVNIEKIWVDENGNSLTTDSEFGAVFDVQNFDNDTHTYRNYFVESDFPANYFDEYINSGYFIRETVGNENRIKFNTTMTTFTDGDWSENNIAVPKYDTNGREIDYRAVEISKSYPEIINGVKYGFYSEYAWNVTYTGVNELTTSYNYTITNHRTVEGYGHREIAVTKEWVDDGELEYRQPIKIIANNVGSRMVETTTNDTTVLASVGDGTRSVTLTKNNVWEGRFNVSQYEQDENNQCNTNGKLSDSYVYDMSKFSEAPEDPVDDEEYYWSKTDIQQKL